MAADFFGDGVSVWSSSMDMCHCEKPLQLRSELAKLELLLRSGRWKDADALTAEIIMSVSEVRSAWDYSAERVNNLPKELIPDLDSLWLKASSGRFGFSTQYEIWNSVHRDWDAFCLEIGWMTNESKKEGDESGYCMDKHCGVEQFYSLSAPRGHLPLVVDRLNVIFHDTWISQNPFALQACLMRSAVSTDSMVACPVLIHGICGQYRGCSIPLVDQVTLGTNKDYSSLVFLLQPNYEIAGEHLVVSYNLKEDVIEFSNPSCNEGDRSMVTPMVFARNFDPCGKSFYQLDRSIEPGQIIRYKLSGGSWFQHHNFPICNWGYKTIGMDLAFSVGADNPEGGNAQIFELRTGGYVWHKL